MTSTTLPSDVVMTSIPARSIVALVGAGAPGRGAPSLVPRIRHRAITVSPSTLVPSSTKRRSGKAAHRPSTLAARWSPLIGAGSVGSTYVPVTVRATAAPSWAFHASKYALAASRAEPARWSGIVIGGTLSLQLALL